MKKPQLTKDFHKSNYSKSSAIECAIAFDKSRGTALPICLNL